MALSAGGEPGGGEPAIRAAIEASFGAPVCEVMGTGKISISLWGEGPEQAGMHFCGQGLVHVELIDPASEAPVAMVEGAEGEPVYTHLQQRGAPMLRYRSRDHVVVTGTGRAASGRTAPRMRCIGRTDDMLIVRGVNLFPSALREVVATFAPAVSGMVLIRPARAGVRQDPPLPVAVERAEGAGDDRALAERLERAIRDALLVTARVELVDFGTLARSEYKSKLVADPPA